MLDRIQLQLGFFHHLAMDSNVRVVFLDDAGDRFQRLLLLAGIKQRDARLADQNGGLASGVIWQHTDRLAVVLDFTLERMPIRQLHRRNVDFGPAGMNGLGPECETYLVCCSSFIRF